MHSYLKLEFSIQELLGYIARKIKNFNSLKNWNIYFITKKIDDFDQQCPLNDLNFYILLKFRIKQTLPQGQFNEVHDEEQIVYKRAE